jgi:outer membrane lipoprotein SlyB
MTTTTKLASLLLLPTLLGVGCVHSSMRTREWGEQAYGAPPEQQAWERTGHVTRVRETVYEQHGDPAGGAVAGALVGGILGNALSGGHGGGTLVGAIGGAAVGASASQGGPSQTVYEVTIQYDDGGLQTYGFRGYLPFRPGDQVRLTAQGLSRM